MGIVTVENTASGLSVDMLEWNFKTMTIDKFKKQFKRCITQPLQSLLNELSKDQEAEFPPFLKASILGLIHGLVFFWQYDMPNRNPQLIQNISHAFASYETHHVLFLCFQSVKKIRKYCMGIIDHNRTAETILAVSRRLEDMEKIFSGPEVAELRQARPGYSIPLLVCWRIAELGQPNCPNMFAETKIIPIIPETILKDGLSPILCRSKQKEFHDSLMNADAAFYPYIIEACVVCKDSVSKKLQKCSKCQVALYCCKEHQIEHWDTHKHHCKHLLALKNAVYPPIPTPTSPATSSEAK